MALSIVNGKLTAEIISQFTEIVGADFIRDGRRNDERLWA